jgi:two-component system, NtrC family, nitrogen regulation response regulator NtrX
MANILIIDDERSIRNTLKEILEFESHKVDLAEDGKQGLEMAKNHFYDIIFCDIKMPKMDGIEVLKEIKKSDIDSLLIMISGHANIENAVEALKLGAFDFIEKPLDLNRILVTIKNASSNKNLTKENKILTKKIKDIQNSNIIGESEEILEIKTMIKKVAPSDARVLITGPNGSGKELVARGLHDKSNRSKGPFIEVNCAAIPSELIESELFGHEKGAFTSAVKMKKGKFEQAEGGTIFLDEIGDMSASAQAKVLRALQENKIQRVGGEKDIKINARVFAATNKDLKKEIEENNFREDLYHRLSVILIDVPSLNKRKSDIPELIEYFLKRIAKEQGTPSMKIDSKAVQELQKKDWTGNIRELRNIIERLTILSEKSITIEDVNKYAL